MSLGKEAIEAIVTETARRKTLWVQLEKIAREALEAANLLALTLHAVNEGWFERIRVVFSGANGAVLIYLLPSGEIMNSHGNNSRDEIYGGYPNLAEDSPNEFATAIAEELLRALTVRRRRSN